MMNLPERFVYFTLDGWRFGLALAATERVIPAVEITPLPKAPPIVLGIVNLHGRVVPVVNPRRRFGLPDRELSPRDQFIIARAGDRDVALVVDSTGGVIETAGGDMVAPESILPAMPYVRGVVRLPDGLVLVHDLQTFLSLEERGELEEALSATEGGIADARA